MNNPGKLRGLACPFCQQRDCMAVSEPETDDNADAYFVHCYCCGAAGPDAGSARSARERWACVARIVELMEEARHD